MLQTNELKKLDESSKAQSSSTKSNKNKMNKNQRAKLLKTLKNHAKNNLSRAKSVAGLSNTLVGGYRAASKIGAWHEPPRDILPKYIQAFCRKMAAAFNVTVVAVEPIPNIHALWASNHISWMDIPVNGSIGQAFFLSKAEVKNMPIFGRLARACGSLFIQRGSGDAGSVSQQMADFLNKGYSIIFFPEATTTDGKQIKKLHGKLLQSAIDSDHPIQPTVLCYVNKEGELDDQIPFYGGMSFKQSLFQVMDSDPVTAYVLPLEPIYPEGRDREELAQLLQARMQRGLDELHRRVVK